MGRVISVLNQQSDVGKTTTVLNLGQALAQSGKKVLLIDLEPSNQLAQKVGLMNVDQGIDVVLMNNEPLEKVSHQVADNVDVICAGSKLADFEQVEGGAARAFRLKNAFKDAFSIDHDFILIDVPSSTGLLAINSLMVSDEVLMPVNCHYRSLQGMSKMLQFVQRIENSFGQQLRLWLAMTRVQVQNNVYEQIKNKIVDCFPQRVLSSVIRESQAMNDAMASGKSIFEFKESSTGAEDYQALAQDLMWGRTS
jgi:chromosome partitioning protein